MSGLEWAGGLMCLSGYVLLLVIYVDSFQDEDE